MSNPDENSGAAFGTPFRALLDHCERYEVRFESYPEDRTLRLYLRGETVLYHCLLRITHDEEILQIRLEYPVFGGKGAVLAQTAEFVARANFGIVIGRFDLDMDTGLLAYHVGHVITKAGLDDETITGLMSSAITSAERYFPGLMRLMFGGHTPADAIYLCELDLKTEAVEPAGEASAGTTKKRVRKSRRRHAAPESGGDAEGGPSKK